MHTETFFITGIDTDAGKTYATAHIANIFLQKGKKVITQKFIQTGNSGLSEDIVMHRKLMHQPLSEDDYQGWTMPEIFTCPCSPHLAAQIDHRPVQLDKIYQATRYLEKKYEIVLIEGAGGLMVPITETFFTVDYIAEKNYPIILVTSGKLGSLNHSLLSLEIIRQRNLRLYALAYNFFPQPEDDRIQKDSYRFLEKYLQKNFPDARMIDIPLLEI